MTATVGDGRPERQSSPPTRRVVDVMSLLVERAGDSLTLAEVVRVTGIPRGTAHAIATQLCELGWLSRRRDNSFSLGPEFLTVSRRAARLDLVAASAIPAMQTLVEETGVPAFLARRTGDLVTVADQVVPQTAPDSWVPPLRRVHLRPPLCREFIAWSDEPERTDWLAEASADQRARLAAVLDAIRDRGYSIERITGHHRAIIDTLGNLDEMPAQLRSRMSELVSELSAIDYLPAELTGEVGAVSVGAPIFDADGTAIGAIVSCPDSTMPADEVAGLGAATRAAADAVSAAVRR
ncbi:IclR family transcriptional regulator [Gordonia sp. PS3]|uniref:Putative IclR family transcriptional regulator n=1 Tax=Gordonia sihwensis NBRC 108236 TaxID=1223544 RepID=L7LH11_9ACTN|nr:MULTISPECIES: helix-turn-helix domain-containing protein [Gordonia]KXT58882.1 IclR family transcriptional regulator [Gordonia sp. QH-12]MBY4569291.1 IclR family transcriptional regulator [Gordonia sihwensis]GAC60400.1 putative IclR family transcriptional regulator [Gordonia sihwensis NBRC 108236]